MVGILSVRWVPKRVAWGENLSIDIVCLVVKFVPGRCVFIPIILIPPTSDNSLAKLLTGCCGEFLVTLLAA